MDLEKDFVWGTATSSYQVEGATYEDGKGLSIWDVFTKEKEKIFEGHTGDSGCCHYHHMKEDVRLLAELGVNAYRFSVSWPRILPEGTGRINEKGIQFYSALVDELLKYGITPYLTLYHWDYPNSLEMQGGWLNPASPGWFEEYTKIVAESLGDRVKNFFTFNEPQVFLWLGYDKCIHAPGIRYPRSRLLTMCRNVALAHGLAVQRLRQIIPDCQVGYAPTCGAAYWPVEEKKELADASKKLQDSFDEENWIYSSAFWNELFLKGKFHSHCGTLFGEDLPHISKEDAMCIAQPLDFCGMNLYQGTPVDMDSEGQLILGKLPAGHGKTGMGWPITPKAMYWAVYNFYASYGIPVLITENGMSALDVVSLDGKVHDPGRIDYLERHLQEMFRSVEDGAKVKGYFHWSFMDNFEWEKGYADRFGLVYIDYQTKKRIPKDSFYWYQGIIKKYMVNGILQPSLYI